MKPRAELKLRWGDVEITAKGRIRTNGELRASLGYHPDLCAALSAAAGETVAWDGKTWRIVAWHNPGNRNEALELVCVPVPAAKKAEAVPNKAAAPKAAATQPRKEEAGDDDAK